MTSQHDPSAFLRSDTSDRPRGDLLRRIDTYYDPAPRATARVEVHGSLVLFVAEQGWPFYARPNLARTTEPTAGEIKEVLARQLELGMPRALEWIHETAPSLATVARAAGMTVQKCPMLVLESLVEPPSAPDGAVRLMNAEDDDLAVVDSAIRVAFGKPGTAVSDAGAAERDDAAASTDARHGLGNATDAHRAGRTVMVGTFVNNVGAVGGGSHNPRGQVSEMVGVGVLPAFRRRGLGAAVAHLLSRHALDNGVTTVFCGADSSDVARVYEGVGFRRFGTTCIAGIS